MHPFIINGLEPQAFTAEAIRLRALYDEFGILIFPRLLDRDTLFGEYVADLKYLFRKLLGRQGITSRDDEPVCDLLSLLSRGDIAPGRYVAELGTQPNKLVSGNLLKFRSEFIGLLKILFGREALLATPAAGDTLHLFPPREEFFRYNLPIHQDYPYLIQSPHQVTISLNLGRFSEDVGGVSFWPGSHRAGLLPVKRNENGHLEAMIDAEGLEKFRRLDWTSGYGDVCVFNGLLLHQSIRNTTKDKSRIVQLFRYSNLNVEEAVSFGWQSTTYPRRGIGFETVHPSGLSPGPKPEGI